MQHRSRVVRRFGAAMVMAVAAVAGTLGLRAASADIIITLPGGCQPPMGFMCPDVFAPVVCDGGAMFPNGCYASAYCATGCVPASGGEEF